MPTDPIPTVTTRAHCQALSDSPTESDSPTVRQSDRGRQCPMRSDRAPTERRPQSDTQQHCEHMHAGQQIPRLSQPSLDTRTASQEFSAKKNGLDKWLSVKICQKHTHIDPLLHRTTLTLWLNFLIFGEAHRGAQHINESALKSQMAIFKIFFKFGRSRGCFAHLVRSNIKYRPNNPPRHKI